MSNIEKEIQVVRLLGERVHESAELASALYERDRLYRREDLYQLIDANRLVAAQTIAELFLHAAQRRDSRRLRALLDALLDAWEARRKRRALTVPPANAHGVGTDYFRRQQRMVAMLGFLAMEIMCLAFELVLRKRSGDFGGGGTAAYVLQVLPELRVPCPIDEDLDDLDQGHECDEEGER